jgi:tetratricopeptide (TPR) repeat protein
MGGCADSRFENMLYAYELGFLSDDERRELELHLLECRHCNERAVQFEQTAHLIKSDPDVRGELERLADKEAGVGLAQPDEKRGVSPARRNRASIVRASLVVAVVLVILLLKPWRFEFEPIEEAVAIENRLVVMYFDDLTGNQDQSRLDEIVTNLLITDLSESQYVQMVSSQRVYDILKLLGHEGARTVDRSVASQVAEKARARWMLLGSILEDQRQTILTSRLVEVSTGDVTASQRVTGERDEELFALIDRLTVDIKSDLSLPAEALGEPDPQVADVTTHSPEAYRYYLEGVDHHSKFYYSEAVASFEKALEYDSTFAMVYYYLAGLHRDRTFMNKAVQYYDNASRKERYFIRAREASFSGNVTLAAQILKEAIEQYSQEKEALYMLGVYTSSLGQNAEAIDYLNRAVALNPQYKLPYNQLAYLYDRTGDFDNAIVSIDKYIELAPGEANPYDSKGQICAGNGHLELAIESYEKALEIRPDFPTSLMYLGYMYLFHGDYERADSCLRALESVTDSRLQSSGRLYLAYIPLHQGKLTTALQILRDGIAAEIDEPTESDLGYKYYLMAQILCEQGMKEQALVELGKGIEVRQTAARYRARTHRERDVQFLAQCGDLAYARALADSLRTDLETYGSPMSSCWYSQGFIEWSKGNLDSSVVLFEKAVAKSAEFEQRYWFARACLETGRLDRAISAFEGLLSRYDSPRAFYGIWSVRAHYYLGTAYEQSGRIDEAVLQYEEFLRIWKNADPGTPLIEEARERMAALKSEA